MVLPLVAFAILALVVSKSLMSVVAREEILPCARSSYDAEPTFDTWGDDARSFLLPASESAAEPAVDANRSERSARSRQPGGFHLAVGQSAEAFVTQARSCIRGRRWPSASSDTP